MADDEERLVVLLEARIKDLERNMAKASGVTERRFREMSLHSKSATRQMEQDATRSTTRINQALAQVGTKIGDFGKAAIGGFIGGLAAGGVAGFVSQVHDLAKGVAEIGDQARTAGLGIKEFQQWKYAAEQNRIGLDAMIDGFKELSLRADEYVATGAGSAAEAFQRLGMSPAEVKERLKNPSELMLELIDRTRRLKDTAAGIRIFDELLGGSGGEQFVRLIEQGREGLTGTLHEAEAVSDFLTDDMVRSAEDVDRAFNRIATTVGTSLKRAVVEAYNALVAFKSLWDGIEESSASGLQARLSQLETRKKQLNDQKGTTEDSILSWIGRDAETEQKAIDDQIRQINEELSRRRTVTPPVVIEPPVDPIIPPGKSTGGSRGKGGASRSAASAAVDREREAVGKLIAELEEELRLVNATDEERRAATVSRQAGSAATAEERGKIIALNESLYQEEKARERAKEALEFQKSALSGMISDLRNGASVGEAFANVLSNIADRIQDDLLEAIFNLNGAMGSSGGGLLGKLFGGLFGGGQLSAAQSGKLLPGLFAKGGAFNGGVQAFAKGGTFSNSVVDRPTLFPFAKGTGLMGEAGPEAIMPLKRDASGRLGVSASGAGGAPAAAQSVRVDVGVSIENDGNLSAYVKKVEQIEQRQATAEADFRPRVWNAVRQGRQWGHL